MSLRTGFEISLHPSFSSLSLLYSWRCRCKLATVLLHLGGLVDKLFLMGGEV